MQEDKEKQPDNVTPIERDLTPEEQDELKKSIKRHPASSVNNKPPLPNGTDAA